MLILKTVCSYISLYLMSYQEANLCSLPRADLSLSSSSYTLSTLRIGSHTTRKIDKRAGATKFGFMLADA